MRYAALLGLIAGTAARDWALHKLDLELYPEARCLDGSPGAFYVQPGVGPAARTFVIHLQGGGWCWGLENCAERAFGGPVYQWQPSLGSSSNWGPGPCVSGTIETNNTPPCVADGNNGGILSSNATLNPALADATKVWFGYCSGDSFAGFVPAPVAVNASMSLFFRGRAILDAVFDVLASDFSLGSAEAVLLKGCSAGGEAVYFLADEVGAKVRAVAPRARYAAMPGAGFLGFGFPAMNGTDIFSPELQWVYENMGLNVSGSAACRAAHAPADAWLCFRSDVTLAYTATPLFVVNSLTDAVQIQSTLALGCAPQAGTCSSAQLAYLDEFTTAMVAKLDPVIHSRRGVRDGAFLVTCVVHVLENMDGSWAGIPVQGVTQAEAFLHWWTSSSGPHAVVDTLWTAGEGKPYGGNPYCGHY